MEETLKDAFDPNRGLFLTTARQHLYPSPASASADPTHLALFEFIGRALGKSIHERTRTRTPSPNPNPNP